jgi:hypothetical protein
MKGSSIPFDCSDFLFALLWFLAFGPLARQILSSLPSEALWKKAREFNGLFHDFGFLQGFPQVSHKDGSWKNMDENRKSNLEILRRICMLDIIMSHFCTHGEF